MFEDKATLTLENQLGTFVKNLTESSRYAKVVQQEREIRELEWKEKERIRAERERKIKLEVKRVQTFLSMFEKWRKAEQCREFIGKLLSSEAIIKHDEDSISRLRDWCEGIVKSIDPLKSEEANQLIDTQDIIDEDIHNEALELIYQKLKQST